MISSRAQGRILRNRDLLQGLAVLLGVFVLATLCSPADRQGNIIFLDPQNLSNMLRAYTPVAIMGLGMTFVILTAGIDLSVGAILALSAMVTSVCLQSGMSTPSAITLALLAGTMVGFVNGSLVALLRVQPFVVTLATMIGVRGIARELSNGENIGLRGIGEEAIAFADLFSTKPVMIGTFAVLAILCICLLNITVFGRYVKALGDNPLAAAYAGLPVKRVQLAVYGLAGLLAAVAGVLNAARNSTGNPNDGIAAELDVITVVVIGGTSLAGGRGTIVGTVIGVGIIAILTNILGLRNVPANYQLMLKAVIIVAAAALQLRRRQ